jgi:hypothetical protein
MIIDRLIHFPHRVESSDQNLISILREDGGILVSREDVKPVMERHPRLVVYGTREQVEWVTPLTKSNPLEEAFTTYGHEAGIDWAYGDICLVVRIGKAGDRLAYTTVAELKKAYHTRRREEAQGGRRVWYAQ